MIWKMVIAVLLLAQSGFATTNTSASLSKADIQTAIDACAQNGDSVILPAGDVTWADSSPITTTKGMTMRGAGIDLSIIRRGSGTAQMMVFSSPGTNAVTISDITFECGPGNASFGVLSMGDSQSTSMSNLNFRVTRIKFSNIKGRAMTTFGWTRGVIDHCVFHSRTNDRPQAFTNYGLLRSSATGENTNNSSATVVLGTDVGYVYVEDCVWDFQYGGDGSLDMYADAHTVIRYNSFTNCNVFNAHELGNSRTATQWEYYMNQIWGLGPSGSSNSFTSMGDLRSGVGVVWSNSLTVTGYAFALPNPRLSFYRCSGTNVFPPWPAGYYPNDSVTGTNRLDGNNNSIVLGYPGLDMPGWGDPTTFTGTNSTQTKYGAYQWSNTFNGTNCTWDIHDFGLNTGLTNTPTGETIPTDQELMNLNRDYFNGIRPGYYPLIYPHPIILQQDYPNGYRARIR